MNERQNQQQKSDLSPFDAANHVRKALFEGVTNARSEGTEVIIETQSGVTLALDMNSGAIHVTETTGNHKLIEVYSKKPRKY